MDALKHRGDLKDERVEAVMRLVDRKDYLRGARLRFTPREAYEDVPLPLGYRQTISAPSMHAYCLQLLSEALLPGARALDVGAGSGYMTACMSLMVGQKGSVVGVERERPLADAAWDNIRLGNPECVSDLNNVRVIFGNIFCDDLLADEALFNAIHVGAAPPEVPDVLFRLLAPDGLLVVPVGPQGDAQVLMLYHKRSDGGLEGMRAGSVRYVPLTAP